MRRKKGSWRHFQIIGNVCVCARAVRAVRMAELINLLEEVRLMTCRNHPSVVLLFHTKEIDQEMVVTKEIQTVL